MPKMTMDKDGNATIEQNIKGVYVNIMAIATHQTSVDGNRTANAVTLTGGGKCDISYESATGGGFKLNANGAVMKMIDVDDGAAVVILIENPDKD